MAEIIEYQQGTSSAAVPDGYTPVTNPIHPALRTSNRLAHFSADVYDTSAESHLSRLLKILLGDAGVGQLHKRLLLARLHATIGGTNFFDLDSFYGAILGVRRRRDELLLANPTLDVLTPEDWDSTRIRDGSFRSRIEQFARGISEGATKKGLETVLEALLGCEVDVVEMWERDDQISRTWGDVEALGTWGSVEGQGTWGNVESNGTSRPFKQRHVVLVRPHRTLSSEEIFSAYSAIDRIKPAGALVTIQQVPAEEIASVPIARIAADSEHWEVRSTVRNSKVAGTTILYSGDEDAVVSIPVAPWSSFQGEAWSLMAEQPSVIAYTTPATVSMVDQIDPSATDLTIEKVVMDGQEILFSPTNAIRPVQSILAGRMASDGVLACNPMNGWGEGGLSFLTEIPRSNIGTSTGSVSPASVYIDGIPVEMLASVVTKDQSGRLALLFWTSPVRPIDSTSNDIIEIRFDAERELNHVSYEVAAFPQNVSIQAWRRETGVWEEVFTHGHYASSPGGITGAIPAGFVHPYHFGSAHWIKVSTSVNPISAQALRVVFSRTGVGIMPVGIDGSPAPYPLGLRNFDVGFRISDEDSVPNGDPDAVIASTRNVLDQSIQHSIKRYGADLAADGAETYWKCEGMPISRAVTSLYLDIGSGGLPQVIDRIYLDPYCSGPTLNVYWSNSLPDDADLPLCASLEQPLRPMASGNISNVESGDGGLSWPDSLPAWFDFDGDDLGLDLRKSFWWAAEIYPGFSTGQVPNHAAIWSAGKLVDSVNLGDFSVTFTSTNVVFTVCGQAASTNAWSWTPGQKLVLCGMWDATSKTVTIGVRNPDGSFVAVNDTSGTATLPNQPIDALRIGKSVGSAGSNEVSPDLRMIKFAMGYGTPSLESVSGSLDTYCRKPRYAASGVDNTAGTVIRYHPGYEGWNASGGYTFGWMGGHIDMWDQIRWTPIPHDFVLAKGWLKFAPILARYVKLEFSDLVAEPYEPFLVHSKDVKVHNSALTSLAPLSGRSIINDPTPVSPMVLSAGGKFDLGPARGGYPADSGSTDPYALVMSPTSGLVAIDPIVASRLAERAGFGFQLQEWQPRRVGSQFSQTGKHVYSIYTVPHTSKVAYFVGVREVKVGRSKADEMFDAKVYFDTFLDIYNVKPGFTTNYDSGVFYTVQSTTPGVLGSPLSVQSKIMSSYSDVEAIQFATQQTPPQQIVPDDRFKSSALSTSDFTDTAGWTGYSDGIVVWHPARRSVLVTRDPALVTAVYGPDSPIVHPPVSPVFSLTNTSITTVSSSSIGGIITPQLPVSSKGMLHVAARITPYVDLKAPLYLQLYGSDQATLLREVEITGQKDVQIETVMPYMLGSNPLLESSVYAAVVQKGPYRDSWIMGALSVFDDGMLWEFSIDGGSSWVPGLDTRNNWAGVVRFPRPGSSLQWRCTMYRQSVGINSIQIRPWYRRRIGGV